MEREENASFVDYAAAIWRGKWLFAIVSFIILIIGIAVILNIPLTYRSTGVIQVEQQEIPTQWVNSTVSSAAADRIQAIGQLVMTTANLSAIIEKFGLYKSYRDTLNLDQLVNLVKASLLVEPIRSRDQRSVVAFRISYDDQSPEIALNVANELVSLYLSENLRSRKQSVTDTRRFLEEEANRIEAQLAEIEEKISVFKEQHQNALPEFQDINLQSYDRVEQQIGDIDRALRSLEERRTVLETGIDSAMRLLKVDSENSTQLSRTNPSAQKLSELKARYSSIKTRYSDVHPDIVKLRREIKSLESELSSKGVSLDQSSSNSQDSNPQDVASIRLRTELNSAIIEQRSLRKRRVDLIEKLDELEKRINKTPKVELEYRSLIRNHENLQKKYNDIRNKQNSARVSESLEQEQKSERFTLIEPPRLAQYPHSPNHKKLFVLALGAAFISGLAAVFGINMIDNRIRNINTVSLITQVPVLTTVGYIESPGDRRRRIRKLILIIVMLTLLVGIGVYLIKTNEITIDSIVPTNLLEFLQSRLKEIGLLK